MIARIRNFGLAETVGLQMQVQAWVEARFQPADDDVVMVNQIVCGQPGCPPLETVIALLPEGRKPVKFKLYKALADVTEADVQGLGRPGWTLRSGEAPW